MKANNSLRINMPRALELISFFFRGHGPTYLISDLFDIRLNRVCHNEGKLYFQITALVVNWDHVILGNFGYNYHLHC